MIVVETWLYRMKAIGNNKFALTHNVGVWSIATHLSRCQSDSPNTCESYYIDSNW